MAITPADTRFDRDRYPQLSNVSLVRSHPAPPPHRSTLESNLSPRRIPFGNDCDCPAKTMSTSPILIPQSRRAAARAFISVASHPTPPSFDGPERRNRTRNHDPTPIPGETHLHARTPTTSATTTPTRGGLPIRSTLRQSPGDLNSDPIPRRQSPRKRSSDRYSPCDRLQDVAPESERTPATALFGTRQLRVDYVAPLSQLHVQKKKKKKHQRESRPGPKPTHNLGRCLEAADHRNGPWIDLQLPTPVSVNKLRR